MRSVAVALTCVLLSGCVAPAQKQAPEAKAAQPPPPKQVALPAPPPAQAAKPVVLPPPDSLLGDPSFRRRDAPAELWQFHGEACVLDLFLYPPAAGGPHQVTHYEVRGRGERTRSARDCFHDLLRARARPAKVSS